MRVLVACEESQSVTIELRKLGHEAYSCDLQECSGGHPEWHILGDATKLIDGDCSFETQSGRHYIYGKWDMLICHPPCTYLTNGGAVRMYVKKGVIDQERYKKAMAARELFMRFMNANCDRIAIENPLPMKCVNLPPYTQVIQPYQFGEPYSKKTCLWLKGLPLLQPTNVLSEYQPFINGGGGRLNRPNYKGKKFATDDGVGKKRSKTFKGIAEAMATQWTTEQTESWSGCSMEQLSGQMNLDDFLRGE